MSVAEQHGRELCGARVEMQRVQVVQQVKVVALEQDDLGFWQFARRAVAVDIAADGCDGGDLFKLAENRDLADVAKVKGEEIAGVLSELFRQYATDRRPGEGFGDFCSRTQPALVNA